jgi:hypothetical protein
MCLKRRSRRFGISTVLAVVATVALGGRSFAESTIASFYEISAPNSPAPRSVNATAEYVTPYVDKFHQTIDSQTLLASFGGAGLNTGIEVSLSTGQQGFLNFAFTSYDNVYVSGRGVGNQTVQQDFVGSFSITSHADGSGITYLAGTGLDGSLEGTVGGNSFGLLGTVQSYSGTLVSTKHVSAPLSFGWTFTNGTPPVSAVVPDGSTTETIGSFSSVVTGSFSADSVASVPEPSTLSLLGAGAAGLVFSVYRRRNRTSAV